MNAQELWNKYKKINPSIGDDIDAWQFGLEADLLAKLVLEGTKTATASAYDLYAVDNDPLPEVGSYDVILDGQEQAVCIIKIIKVSIVPFKDVSAEHAWKEGEGDKSLDYWRDVHEEFFKPYFEECGLTFTPESLIVLEEFQVVYPQN
ncbi:ASCH domain-containing protein [Streptococcus sp. FT1-106]|uniref:ASCH domain-containing protein n=1 Tax=unclassified Streptococcus TaxID=2608887 RepID=UPI003BF57C84